MFCNTSDFKGESTKCLIYGSSGVGKTTALATLPGKTLLVSAENGLLSISDKDIDVYDLTVDKNGKALDRHLRFEKLNHFLSKVLPELEGYDTLAIDSLTEIAQNIVENLKIKHPESRDALKMWGEYSAIMTALVKSLRDLPGYNVVMTALSSVDKDEQNRRFIGIDVNGKISGRIPALLDEVFYMQVMQDDEGKEHRVFVTSNHGDIIAKDRSGKLNQFEQPDFGRIFAKIKGD